MRRIAAALLLVATPALARKPTASGGAAAQGTAPQQPAPGNQLQLNL